MEKKSLEKKTFIDIHVHNSELEITLVHAIMDYLDLTYCQFWDRTCLLSVLLIFHF